ANGPAEAGLLPPTQRLPRAGGRVPRPARAGPRAVRRRTPEGVRGRSSWARLADRSSPAADRLRAARSPPASAGCGSPPRTLAILDQLGDVRTVVDAAHVAGAFGKGEIVAPLVCR